MIINTVPRNQIADKEGNTPPVWRTFFTQVFTAVQAWISFPYFTQTASKTVADSVTETTLFSTGEGLLTFPVNAFQPGSRVTIRAEGYFSTTGTPTLTFTTKLGSTTLTTSGAVTTATVSGKLWKLEADFVCRTNGPTGTVFGQGVVMLTTSGTVLTSYGMVTTAAVTIDTTAQQTVDLTVTWGTASASNTITCTNAEIEVT